MKHHETIHETQNSNFLNKLIDIEPLTKHFPKVSEPADFVQRQRHELLGVVQ
jgi:hypothetical protein